MEMKTVRPHLSIKRQAMTAIQATSIRRILRVILCSAVGILLTGPLSAQPLSDRDQVNDLLDQVRREQEVAAQKIEAEVRQALGDAVRLISQSPARASESLRKIQAFLEEDTLLPTARRDAQSRSHRRPRADSHAAARRTRSGSAARMRRAH